MLLDRIGTAIDPPTCFGSVLSANSPASSASRKMLLIAKGSPLHSGIVILQNDSLC